MQQELSRRAVWLLGANAQGARLESALADAGSACQRFESVEALQEAIEHDEPALVLVSTDAFAAPDALETFVDHLRRRPSSAAPIVVVTDDGSVEMRRRMFKAGVDDFVLEPVVTSELVTRVRSQLMLNGAHPGGDASQVGGAQRPAEDTPLSILVADAEPMIQRVLRSAFERRGWFVTRAGDGREAMQLATEHQFNLVVMDLNLPFKNGFELLGELGGAAAASRPHMVVLSAEGQQESVLRAFELGADDFVKKPVNPDILIARIERLVRPDGASTTDGH